MCWTFRSTKQKKSLVPLVPLVALVPFDIRCHYPYRLIHEVVEHLLALFQDFSIHFNTINGWIGLISHLRDHPIYLHQTAIKIFFRFTARTNATCGEDLLETFFHVDTL